jgi:hypothetical protein
MNSVVSLTALAVALGVPLPEGKVPSGPIPLKRVAFLDLDGNIKVEETLAVEVTVCHKGPVVEGRKPPGSKRVTFTRTAVYDPMKVQVYDAKGHQVDPLDLPKLLAIPAPAESPTLSDLTPC